MNEPFTSIQEIKRANERRGHHYFEPSTMRFFDSRLCYDVEPLPNGGGLFVTSERFHGSNGYVAPRKYTIRYAMPDGSIDTVGEFQAFTSRTTAIYTMKKLARWLRETT